MRIIYINKKMFLDWYFDKDMTDNLGDTAVWNLKRHDKFEITTEEILDNVMYIPNGIVINLEDLSEQEIEANEVDFKDTILKFKEVEVI